MSGIFNQSFFEQNRILILNEVSDKSLQFIEEILEKNLTDVKVILNAGILEKNLKLEVILKKISRRSVCPFIQMMKKYYHRLLKNFL